MCRQIEEATGETTSVILQRVESLRQSIQI